MKRLLWLACVFASASALAQAPDIVLVNGKIHTLDAKSTVAEALAIRGGREWVLGPRLQGKTLGHHGAE